MKKNHKKSAEDDGFPRFHRPFINIYLQTYPTGIISCFVSQKNYILGVKSNIFRFFKSKFSPSRMLSYPIPRPSHWCFATVNVLCEIQAKGHALFVDMDQFRDPTHFGKIMGYNDDISSQQQNINKNIFELNPDDLAKKEDSQTKQ